ncbi:MAG: calcium-binding protein [Solirubrobacterales bacterium]
MGRVPRCFATLRRTASVAFGAVAIAAVAPVAADATTTCEYNAGAEVLNVSMAADNDSTILRLIGTTIDVRQASGLVSCSGGTPTTANTEAINVFDNSGNGATSLAVFTPQAFAVLEINDVPGNGTDRIAISSENVPATIIAGSDGVNTDGAAGRDVNFIGTPENIEIFGGSANDTITARGGGGTGAMLNGPFVQLRGGDGNDTLEGTEIGDLLEGELGNDTMRGFGGEDGLIGDVLAASADDVYDGGAGFDTISYPLVKNGVTVDLAKVGPQATGNGNDSFSEIEGVIGSEFGDTLLGTAGPNVLKAGQGDDTVDGRGGDDLLSGASGTDTLTYAAAPAGVVVDLGAGTASGGFGTDSATEFENLIGSPFADVLTGSAAANAITGLAGADTVKALAGPDRVDVRDGGPDNASCGSEVDSAIADRRSVDTVQADCELVDALPEPGGGGAGGGPGVRGKRVAFVLGGARKQRLLVQRAVRVKLRCPQEACTVVVAAAGRVPALVSAGVSAARRLRLKPVTAKLAAGVAKAVKLRLNRRQRALIGAAMRLGKRPKLRVTATATDAAGKFTRAQLTVTAKR